MREWMGQMEGKRALWLVKLCLPLARTVRVPQRVRHEYGSNEYLTATITDGSTSRAGTVPRTRPDRAAPRTRTSSKDHVIYCSPPSLWLVHLEMTGAKAYKGRGPKAKAGRARYRELCRPLTN